MKKAKKEGERRKGEAKSGKEWEKIKNNQYS